MSPTLPMPSADNKGGMSSQGQAIGAAPARSQTTAPVSEDAALALLKRMDTSADVLEQLSKGAESANSPKVRLRIAAHPRTPRHVSLPLLRHLFTFQLMEVALAPAVPGDVRVAAEEALIRRLETIPLGEKISLARRASGRVAAALLLDAEPRVMETALENSRLTEAAVVKTLLQGDASAGLVQAICRHPKWSLRREVRFALLCNANTPLAQAVEFARGLRPAAVAEILQSSNLPATVKAALRSEAEGRS